MSPDKYPGTLLPTKDDFDKDEQSKVALDLLKKINETDSNANAALASLSGSLSSGINPSGAMIMFSGATAPAGWLLCNGAEISRQTYAALFAVIGTAWGVGDGASTFNIPDMRGAAPAGVGVSTGYTENETVTLGAKSNDQFQGHSQRIQPNESGITANDYLQRINNIAGATANNTTLGHSTVSAAGNRLITTDFITDAVTPANGTPRTGAVTKGKTVGVNFIVKT